MQLICLLIKSQYIFSIGTMNPSRRIFPSYKMNIILKLHMGNLHIAEIGKKQKIMEDSLRLTLNILCDVVRSLYHVYKKRHNIASLTVYFYSLGNGTQIHNASRGARTVCLCIPSLHTTGLWQTDFFIYLEKGETVLTECDQPISYPSVFKTFWHKRYFIQ